MRALFKSLLAALCITMMLNFGDVLIGSRKFLEEPRIHVVQEGEYFSKLAKDYYGNADYWRALALINRAPNVDRIYPGEHVMLPDAGTIASIANSQRMTEVNELVNNQQALATLETQQKAREFEKDLPVAGEADEPVSAEDPALAATDESVTKSETLIAAYPAEDGADGNEAYQVLAGFRAEETEKSAMSGMLWPVAGSAAVLFAAIAFAYRRHKNQQEDEPEIDASPIKSFILENELESQDRSATMTHTSASNDDIFKPVRRRNEVENEKEVAFTV